MLSKFGIRAEIDLNIESSIQENAAVGAERSAVFSLEALPNLQLPNKNYRKMMAKSIN